MTVVSLLALLSIGAYLASSGLWVWRWRVGALPLPWRSVALTLASVGALLHLLALWHYLHTGSGFNFGFFHAASLIGVTMTWLWLIALLGQQPLDNLGLALLPATALTLSLEMLYPTSAHIIRPQHWHR